MPRHKPKKFIHRPKTLFHLITNLVWWDLNALFGEMQIRPVEMQFTTSPSVFNQLNLQPNQITVSHVLDYPNRTITVTISVSRTMFKYLVDTTTTTADIYGIAQQVVQGVGSRIVSDLENNQDSGPGKFSLNPL